MGNAWLNNNRDRSETVWAAGASLSFHALLVLILNTTSSLDFTIGRETQLDIFWLSPSSLPSAIPAAPTTLVPPLQAPLALSQHEAAATSPPLAAIAPVEQLTSAMNKAVSAGSRRPAPDATAGESTIAMLTATPAARKAPAPAAAAKGEAVERTVGEKSAPAVETALPHPAKAALAGTVPSAVTQELFSAVKAATAIPAGREAEKIAKAQELPTEPKTTTQRISSPQQPARPSSHPECPQPSIAKFAKRTQQKSALLLPVSHRLKVIPPARVTASRPREEIAVAPYAAHPPALTKAALGKPREEARQETTSQHTASGVTSTSNVSRPVLTVPPSADAAAKDAAYRPSERPPQEGGLVITSLQGDLKILISGDSGIRLVVTFKPYPKSRHKTAMTRAEARREQRVTPVFGKSRSEGREAVIETAREGIYTFSVEPERGEPAKATFILKIFETGPLEKTATLGTRIVATKIVLAKVIMPEGILWDDDSAFTGSLEDSDSTTKFNAQSGLYWKEFND